jgi:ATP synthase protein I
MSERPGGHDDRMTGQHGAGPSREDDLERRRRDLDAAISARRPVADERDQSARSGGMAGVGNALRLSSEFIAGIVVGAALGWIIDYYAGTSPFGLIVFLLLGFAAGVLNALRSAGLVAQFGTRTSEGDGKGSAKD